MPAEPRHWRPAGSRRPGTINVAMKHPASAVVLMLAAALVPSATAGKGPHAAPSTSSIAQYVEQLPSATGSVPLGQGSGAVARLSPAAKKALSKSGGSDASTLQKIAVDSQSGAPAESQAGHVPPDGERERSARIRQARHVQVRPRHIEAPKGHPSHRAHPRPRALPAAQPRLSAPLLRRMSRAQYRQRPRRSVRTASWRWRLSWSRSQRAACCSRGISATDFPVCAAAAVSGPEIPACGPFRKPEAPG